MNQAQLETRLAEIHFNSKGTYESAIESMNE